MAGTIIRGSLHFRLTLRRAMRRRRGVRSNLKQRHVRYHAPLKRQLGFRLNARIRGTFVKGSGPHRGRIRFVNGFQRAKYEGRR